ncbi:MAG: flagellar export chaperone FlgN [Blautia sp.]|nr:flagellar export chaperone FlgN [Blautia sp.]
MENQLTILSESLDKKLQVLNEIQEYNRKQERSFLEETANLDDFDAAIEEKGRLIERLGKLDEGFETVYGRLAEELKGNREKYQLQIRELQDKIRQVTELGVSIQAQEQRNKKLVEQYFAKAHNNLRQDRKNSRAMYDYYKRMSGINMPTSQFMDSKQ